MCFLRIKLRILEAVCPEEAEGYKHWREAVEGGFTMHYDIGAPWLGEEMDIEDQREVLDILDMYSALGHSYKQLDDKSGIEPAPGDVSRIRWKQRNCAVVFCGILHPYVGKVPGIKRLRGQT